MVDIGALDDVPSQVSRGVERLLTRVAADLAAEEAALVTWSSPLEAAIITSSATPTDPADLTVRREGLLVWAAHRAADRNAPVLIGDLALDPLVDDAHGSGAVLAVGVEFRAGMKPGALVVTSDRAREWTNSDIERSSDMAALLAGLVETCALLADTRARLAEQTRSRDLGRQLHRVASRNASAASTTEIAQVMVTEGPAVLGATFVAVLHRDDRSTWATTGTASDADGHAPELLAEVLTHLATRSNHPQRTLIEADPAGGSFAAAVHEAGHGVLVITPFDSANSEQHLAVMVTGFADTKPSLLADLLIAELVRDGSSAMERAQLAQAKAREAHTLQRSLLPARVPQLEGFEILTLYRPAADGAYVGGDWYDVVPITDQLVGFIVGDVAGHDVRSAALMGQFRHVLASQLRDHRLPGIALGNTDDYFAERNDDLMATAVVLTIDLSSGICRVALAGHPAPIIWTRSGASLIECRPGAPLGFGFGGYHDTLLEVADGDLIAAFTDGAVERRRGSMSQHLEQLVDAVDRSSGSATELIAMIEQRSEFTGLVDDVAALVVGVSTGFDGT